MTIQPDASNHKPYPTQTRIKELLHYNPSTGVFTRITTQRGREYGSIAGTKDKKDYIKIGIDYKIYPAHILAWLYVTGRRPAKKLRHINGIRDDNRFFNLCEATPQPKRTRSDLTVERVRELLHYCPASGVFTWRVNRRGSNSEAGMTAGSIVYFGPKGYEKPYIAISVDGVNVRGHQLAFFYMVQRWPAIEIDHINGNGMDNRWKNLREATRKQNSYNRRTPRHNTSGHKGIVWHKKLNKWRAQIFFNGKNISLGLFTTKPDAIAARRAAELEFFGDFAPRHDTAAT